MEELTRNELDRLTLIGNNVIVKLPADTDDKNKTLTSGIVASFIYSDKEKYAPVFGTVYKRGKKSQLRDGDQVFFHYLCWDNAKHSAESFKNGHYDSTKIALQCEGHKYLLMSESEIFFAKRDETFISMNDTVLLRGIKKDLREEVLKDARGLQVGKVWVSDSTGAIALPDISEQYRDDIAEVVCAPEGELKKGDIVYPDKYWSVPLEYEILKTVGEELFYVKLDVVLAHKN